VKVGKMLRNIVFLALALALVSAVEDNAYGEALDTIKLMKSQGLGANECQALADSSLTSVSSAKDTNQKLLNSLALAPSAHNQDKWRSLPQEKA